MENSLEKLVSLSHKFGKNPEFILAGGGNSSYKNNYAMWVKASGTSMADIDEDGFVCLDRKLMQVLSRRNYSKDASLREEEVKKDLQSAILEPKGKRPSVEASMHEVIQYKFIMHTHPTLVNGLLCANESKKMITELFGDDAVYVPYTDPGYVLFKKVVAALQDYKEEFKKEAQIIFLENHGVFVGADTCEEIDEIYVTIDRKLTEKTPTCLSDINTQENQALLTLAHQIKIKGNNDAIYSICDNSELVKFFVEDEKAFSKVAIPFTPDNIVYCKSKYLYNRVDDDVNAQIEAFLNDNGYYPKVIAFEGKGLVCIEESEKSAKIVLDVFKDMMKVSYLSESFGGPRAMTQEQIDFIDNWEVENYRRQMSKQTK
ncbi:class II aldolase/adducin family protein [Labilibacter marinus]|uniref:class II aldolase/adducin family protein n=1 Tax=Labilibacter marinus TaxID=1477105 RepID=UPI0008333F53|nr:class II aldolase/adducin family protein [Labilibacter marinus]